MAKKNKIKTHKATAKRMKLSGSKKKAKVRHLPQGAGNGHSMSYKNRRQKAAKKSVHSLGSNKQAKTVKQLIQG